MTTNVVGFKLIDVRDNTIIQQWGGAWGECPAVPNPIILPNGDHLHAPEIGVDYSGYKLMVWEMDPPVVKELTLEEKLASVGITLNDLKTALNLT